MPNWEIVGGSEKGGIMVREGEGLKTTELAERLSTGALVEEIELKGARLHYKLLQGTGPAEGWVSIKLKEKDLVIRSERLNIPAPGPKPTTVGPNNEEPLPIAILFPGQGSQYVGMLKAMQDNPVVKDMLTKANTILGWDVLELCLNGPEEKLEETMYCQPVMFIGGLAGLEKLKADRPEAVTRCSVMAGLSLGEYTALCAAGVLPFEDCLKLVKLRGEAMQAAARGDKKQQMLSVAGLDYPVIADLCRQAQASEGAGGVCSVSNYLFPKGTACGGTADAIGFLEKAAVDAGAMQAKVIKAGGAFHTTLMQPAQDKLAAALDEALPKMKPPQYTVWMNASAAPVRPGCDPATHIVPLMKLQLTNSVRWAQSMDAMLEEGVQECYECGPMKQLKAMMKRINPEVWKKTTNVDV